MSVPTEPRSVGRDGAQTEAGSAAPGQHPGPLLHAVCGPRPTGWALPAQGVPCSLVLVVKSCGCVWGRGGAAGGGGARGSGQVRPVPEHPVGRPPAALPHPGGTEREAPGEDARLGLIYGGRGRVHPRATALSGACCQRRVSGRACRWLGSDHTSSEHLRCFHRDRGQVIYGCLLPRGRARASGAEVRTHRW